MKRPPFVLFLLLAVAGCHRESQPPQLTQVTDPHYVTFTASADQLRVDHYELRILAAPGSAPVAVQNLGKPQPDDQRMIKVQLSPELLNQLQKQQTYYVEVASVGADGSKSAGGSVNTFVLK